MIRKFKQQPNWIFTRYPGGFEAYNEVGGTECFYTRDLSYRAIVATNGQPHRHFIELSVYNYLCECYEPILWVSTDTDREKWDWLDEHRLTVTDN